MTLLRPNLRPFLGNVRPIDNVPISNKNMEVDFKIIRSGVVFKSHIFLNRSISALIQFKTFSNNSFSKIPKP